jgi:hypothetical protein
MENDLVKKDSSLMHEAADAWGAAGKSTGALTIRCEIGQPTSSGKEVGMFNFSNEEWKPALKLTNLVVVYPGRTRVLYGKGIKVKRRCGSDNFATPSSLIPEPINVNCYECPLSKWDSDLSSTELSFKRKMEVDTGKQQALAPLCKDTIQLVVVDERMVPFSLRFQKGALNTVTQKLINRIKYKGKMPFEVSFSIALKKGDSNKGNYYEYVFEEFRDLTQEEQEPYRDMFMFFKENGERMMSDHIAGMDAEKEVSPIVEEPPF